MATHNRLVAGSNPAGPTFYGQRLLGRWLSDRVLRDEYSRAYVTGRHMQDFDAEVAKQFQLAQV